MRAIELTADDCQECLCNDCLENIQTLLHLGIICVAMASCQNCEDCVESWPPSHNNQCPKTLP